MLIEKIVETILEKLSISKVFLVFTIVFILATLIVYIFSVTNEFAVMLITFFSFVITCFFMCWVPAMKETKKPTTKRRKK